METLLEILEHPSGSWDGTVGPSHGKWGETPGQQLWAPIPMGATPASLPLHSGLEGDPGRILHPAPPSCFHPNHPSCAGSCLPWGAQPRLP